MGRKTRSAAPGVSVKGETAAPGAPVKGEAAAPGAPVKGEAAAVKAEPAPATAEPTAPATLRKSIRILTRKDKTPKPKTPKKTTQTQTTTQPAAIAHEPYTRISIDQLLASSPLPPVAPCAPAACPNLVPYEPTAQHRPIDRDDPRSRGLEQCSTRGSDLAKPHEGDDLANDYCDEDAHHDDDADGDTDDDIKYNRCDAHHDNADTDDDIKYRCNAHDATSEEEQLSKDSRQHGQRPRRTKQAPNPEQPSVQSPQKRSATGRFQACSHSSPNADRYQVRPPPPPLLQSSPPPPIKMIVERRIKLVTEQHNIPKAPQVEGFPMKEWTVEVYILDEAGKEKPARCFHKVVYNLHPSFANPVQTFHEPPFKCTNEGWGEFEMTIDCYTTEKGGKQTILHDLNFANPTYENIHTIQFKNPSQALQALLRETGPLPTDEDRKARKNLDGAGGSSIASKKKKTYDLEKMADAIPRLSEDDLLHVIQLIHDNKNDDTYIMNNPDAGEFSIDLYTMPDNLCRLMWEFLSPEGHRLR